MSPEQAVNDIEDLIAVGLAYTLNVPDIAPRARFVYLDFTMFLMKCTTALPTLVSCLETDTMKHGPNDYCVWVPDVNGVDSPWGKGGPTPNLEQFYQLLKHQHESLQGGEIPYDEELSDCDVHHGCCAHDH